MTHTSPLGVHVCPRRGIRPSALVLLLFVALMPAIAAADEAGALKYLEQAKKQVADKAAPAEIRTTLQLAEAELTGVDAAERDPIVAQINALREQMVAADTQLFQAETLRTLDRDFETAEKLLGVRNAGIVKMLDDLDKKLNDSKVQTALGPTRLGEYRQKLGSFQSVNRTKLGEAAVDEMKRQVEFVEKEFPETIKSLKEGAPLAKQNMAASFGRRYEQFVELAKEAPKDNPTAFELAAKMDAMKKQVDAAFGMAEAAEVHDRLKRNWDSYAADWQGWEAETSPPKFADLVGRRSEAFSRLGAPKTAKLYNEATRFLENLAQNEQAKPYLNAPPVKDLVDGVTKLRDQSLIKLQSFAQSIISEAENTPLNADSRNRLESLANDDLRLSLAGSPQLASFQKRALDAVARFDGAARAGATAMNDARKQLNEAAAARWPNLLKPLTTTSRFDPAKPDLSSGTLIRLAYVKNRSGLLDDGRYDFAMEIDGKPLVGKFSPEIKQAIADAKAKTGVGLPEDTVYDVIALYDGEQGVMQRRSEFEARTTDGQVAIRGEERKGESVPILNIIGLYCGPVAVLSPAAASVGQANPAPAQAPPPAAGGGNPAVIADADVASVDVLQGGSVWYRLVDMLVMGLAGLCVLVKAQFAPLATTPQLGVVRENLTQRNQMIIGFLFLALAVVKIIGGYILYGLIGNVALGAAGLFLALEFFQRQSWFKPQWAEQVRKFAVPIGITCAGIGILRLFLGAMLLAV